MFFCCGWGVEDQVVFVKCAKGSSDVNSTCKLSTQKMQNATMIAVKRTLVVSSIHMQDDSPSPPDLYKDTTSRNEEEGPSMNRNGSCYTHDEITEPDEDSISCDASFQKLCNDSNIALEGMRESWGITVPSFILDPNALLTQKRLDSLPDAVLLSQSWNKVLAFRSMFAEALVGRWRMLTAVEEIQKNDTRKQSHFADENTDDTIPVTFPSHIEVQALRMVENNLDPLAKSFGTRIVDLEILIVGVLDAAVRGLCPHQVIQREAYRPQNGSADSDPRISRVFFHEDECVTFEDFCTLFARYGVQPQCWMLCCEAFLWNMKRHVPYSIDDEKDDLHEATSKSAHGRFIAGMVVLPMIEATLCRASHIRRSNFEDMKMCCSIGRKEAKFEDVGVRMFNKLFHEFPEIADYFTQPDVDEMSVGIFEMIHAVAQGSCDQLSDPQSKLRLVLQKQSIKWIELKLPNIETYSLMINGIIEAMEPLFRGRSKSAERLKRSFKTLFREAMHILLHPILLLQNLRTEASQFYKDIATELGWSSQKLQKRLFEVFTEIATTGQYVHTEQELEIGCKLAWRNSVKCIGRIAWDTLVVRDRRHCTRPDEIFNEVLEHLKAAAGGTSIQSVMTVFRPQQPDELWGLRFWSSQFVRYAGYKDRASLEILGDTANADFTSYLIETNLWKPPAEKSAFDVLPLVIKVPGNDTPFVYELPKAAINEVKIEHPKFAKVKDLGYKWTTIPAINNFIVTLGGIKYTAAPFNGWYVTTEIARNLLERYGATKPLATAMGFELNDTFLAQKISTELESAILFSFEKNKITMVDPDTVGRSFLTHCKREQSSGRECPAQWSWIGGLVGPTNPVWHLEMKDFYKTPRFDYCCDPWRVTDLRGIAGGSEHEADGKDLEDSTEQKDLMPKVLIAFGSETGTAESIALTMARLLKVCEPSVSTLNEAYELMIQRNIEYTHILIICSTFGSGYPPTNAMQFFKGDLKGKVPVDISYSVLALGSTLYLDDFCKAGKSIHRKMEAAGARPMTDDVTCVDAAQGRQDTTAMNWCSLIKKLLLPESLMAQVSSSTRARRFSVCGPPLYTLRWNVDTSCSKRSPVHVTRREGMMRCIENKDLLKDGNISDRSTRHIELQLPHGVVYQVGDHLSITPVNDFDMVSRFCQCFAQELEETAAQLGLNTLAPEQSHRSNVNVSSTVLCQYPFHVECIENGRASPHPAKHLSTNNTLHEVLRLYVDLSFTSKPHVVNLLSLLSTKLLEREHAPPPSSSSTSTSVSRSFIKMATEAIQQYHDLGESAKLDDIIAQYPTIVHFLERFRTLFCERDKNKQPVLSIVDLLILMPRLKPRRYSISSSNMTSPHTLSITVGVLNYHTRAVIKAEGVCSHYLAKLKPGDMVDAQVLESSFKPPTSSSSPIIMISAGTGLAPFMGFLNDRAASMNTNTNMNVNQSSDGVNFGACHLLIPWLNDRAASRKKHTNHQSSDHGDDNFGECHLFFGCRSDKEILYKDQLMEWDSNGVMQLHLALSRPHADSNEPKQYVQDCLGQDPTGRKIANLLLSNSNQDTCIYICGDAEMAKSCSEVFISLLAKYGNMSNIAAGQYIKSMRIDNRWQFDVWSRFD